MPSSRSFDILTSKRIVITLSAALAVGALIIVAMANTSCDSRSISIVIPIRNAFQAEIRSRLHKTLQGRQLSG